MHGTSNYHVIALFVHLTSAFVEHSFFELLHMGQMYNLPDPDFFSREENSKFPPHMWMPVMS
jgi:hypothetical protein